MKTASFIIDELQSVASTEKAAHLSRFFKTGPGEYGEGDRFLGIPVPLTRNIAKANIDTPLEELQILHFWCTYLCNLLLSLQVLL